MKAAFATRTGKHVDAELRSAPRIDVYEITETTVRLDRTSLFEGVAPGTGARLAALAGVDMIYVSAMGPSVAARLAAHGIRPATSRTGARIDVVLAHLQHLLRVSARDASQPERCPLCDRSAAPSS